MKMNEPTYTLWIGSHLAATRPHTTENYIDLLGIAGESSGHVCIYSSREDAPVYDSQTDADAWAGQGCIQPDTGERAYDGWEGCWSGDGSGMDDLADFNQMEGNDC